LHSIADAVSSFACILPMLCRLLLALCRCRVVFCLHSIGFVCFLSAFLTSSSSATFQIPIFLMVSPVCRRNCVGGSCACYVQQRNSR
jgi:hypothetical protein